MIPDRWYPVPESSKRPRRPDLGVALYRERRAEIPVEEAQARTA